VESGLKVYRSSDPMLGYHERGTPVFRHWLPETKWMHTMKTAVVLPGILALMVLVVAAGCISLAGVRLSPRDAVPATPPGADVSPGSAIAVAFRSDEINPTHPEARDWFIMGLTIGARGNQYEDAIACYDKALAIDPAMDEAWLARGVALHNPGRYKEAADNYDRALAQNPDIARISFVGDQLKRPVGG
jgi:hypothetical protein